MFVRSHTCLFLFCQKLNSNSIKIAGLSKCVVEVGARPAGASTGGVGCRAIAGGCMMTINPDLVCMRLGNTEHHHRTARTCVPSRPLQRRLCTGKGCQERGCQAGVSSHAARIARSNAVPRIERVPCLLCLVCLYYQAQCAASGTVAAPATSATTVGTHAPVPIHPLQHSANCMSQSFLRLRAFR